MSSVHAEKLMIELLNEYGYVDTVLPEDSAQAGLWEEIYPIVVVNRLPSGGVDDDGLVDLAHVVVLIIGRDYEQAWNTALAIDEKILNDGLPNEVYWAGTEYLLEPASQLTPPSLEPDVNPDPRFVNATYAIPISLRF